MLLWLFFKINLEGRYVNTVNDLYNISFIKFFM